MRKMLKSLMVFASILCLIGTFALSGCGGGPNEDELNVLEETKKAALTAEDELAQKQQEKADLEKELAEKTQKLEYAKSEKAKVKAKLGGN